MFYFLFIKLHYERFIEISYYAHIPCAVKNRLFYFFSRRNVHHLLVFSSFWRYRLKHFKEILHKNEGFIIFMFWSAFLPQCRYNWIINEINWRFVWIMFHKSHKASFHDNISIKLSILQFSERVMKYPVFIKNKN